MADGDGDDDAALPPLPLPAPSIAAIFGAIEPGAIAACAVAHAELCESLRAVAASPAPRLACQPAATPASPGAAGGGGGPEDGLWMRSLGLGLGQPAAPPSGPEGQPASSSLDGDGVGAAMALATGWGGGATAELERGLELGRLGLGQFLARAGLVRLPSSS